MTKLYTIVGLVGLATLPLWDAEWRLALALGWCLSLSAEALLARKRLQTVTSPGSTSLLMVIVFGFLGRLTLVVLGAIVGALGGLYPEGPFLGAFLAASDWALARIMKYLVLGEV